MDDESGESMEPINLAISSCDVLVCFMYSIELCDYLHDKLQFVAERGTDESVVM